jgi:hypothetical protein
MPDDTFDDIKGIFEKMNWNFDVLDDRRILTGIRCPIKYYYYTVPLEIMVKKYWLHVRAFLHRNIPSDRQSAIHTFINILNSQSHGARFFLVEDCVIVQDEIPRIHFSPRAFSHLLESVCRHSEWAGLEIATLATSQSVADLFEITEKKLLSEVVQSISPNPELTLDFDISANKL